VAFFHPKVVQGQLPTLGYGTLSYQNHLLEEMQDWSSDHLCSLKILGHFYKVKVVSLYSTDWFQLASNINFLVRSRKRIYMEISRRWAIFLWENIQQMDLNLS
jgi:hypothetical protein